MMLTFWIRAYDANGDEVQVTQILVNGAVLVGDLASPDVNNDNIDDNGVPSNKTINRNCFCIRTRLYSERRRRWPQ